MCRVVCSLWHGGESVDATPGVASTNSPRVWSCAGLVWRVGVAWSVRGLECVWPGVCAAWSVCGMESVWDGAHAWGAVRAVVGLVPPFSSGWTQFSSLVIFLCYTHCSSIYWKTETPETSRFMGRGAAEEVGECSGFMSPVPRHFT